MNPQKKRSTVGDIAWNVTWTASVPVDEYGDADLDSADERYKRFPNRDSAMLHANAVLPLDYCGAVAVTKCEFMAYDEDDVASHPHVGFWQDIAEPEIVDEIPTCEK